MKEINEINGAGNVVSTKSASEWYELGIRASEQGLFIEAEDYFNKSEAVSTLTGENVKKNNLAGQLLKIGDVKFKSLFTELNETIGSSLRDSFPVEGSV